MPSAFKRRLPAAAAARAAAATSVPATAAADGGAAAASAPPRSSFPSGHAILDALLPQGGPVRLLLPAPHLGHARPLEAHELPAAHTAAAHASSLALLGAGRALADAERVLVVAPQIAEARSWAARIPAPAPAASGSSSTASTPVASGSTTPAAALAKAASDESSLGSAARYAHLVPQLAARGVPSAGSGGEALLDLARTLGVERAQQLEAQGALRCAALGEGSSEVDAVRVLREVQKDGPVHAVLLHAGAALDSRALFRRLLSLRAALHASSSLTLLLSPHWLAQCTPPALSRLLSLSDSGLCLSVFASPLAEAFPAYSGALRCAVQRAPPGRLVCSAPPELGYRARRRGIGIGLLHLDVGGGVGERRTKPAPTGDDIEEAGSSLARKGVPHAHAHEHAAPHEDKHAHTADPQPIPQPPPPEAAPKLTGLAALRARGAQKRAEAAAAAAAAAQHSNT